MTVCENRHIWWWAIAKCHLGWSWNKETAGNRRDVVRWSGAMYATLNRLIWSWGSLVLRHPHNGYMIECLPIQTSMAVYCICKYIYIHAHMRIYVYIYIIFIVDYNILYIYIYTLDLYVNSISLLVFGDKIPQPHCSFGLFGVHRVCHCRPLVLIDPRPRGLGWRTLS